LARIGTASTARDADTFGAFQIRRTDGFGQNRDGIDGSAMFQYGFGREGWRFRVHGGFAGARYNLAGVLRVDDIQASEVGWLDVYPFDTARAQNGFNLDTMLGFSGEHRGENKRNSSFGLWLQFHDFRLKENFSGFLETDESGDTPGDLIEQLDRRFVIGGNARHRTHQFAPAAWAKGTVELGVSGRVDLIGQQLNLVEAPANRVYEERIDADVTETDIGMWLDLDWDFTKFLNITGGVRADVLFYDVTDKQQSVSPDGVVPYRRTAAGVAVGPRTAVTVKPIEELDVVLAYGRGFRSPQARAIIENEDVPFTKVHSADAGLRSRIGKNEELKLALTGFFTKMNNDLIFEAHEARFEPIGPTTRVGAVFYAQARPLPWLYGAFSITYVQATLGPAMVAPHRRRRVRGLGRPRQAPTSRQARPRLHLPRRTPPTLRTNLPTSEPSRAQRGAVLVVPRAGLPGLQPAGRPIRCTGVRVRVQLGPERPSHRSAGKAHRRRRPENLPISDRL
jgi:outer membrane receptor protein involved in Fe transport